ncbi:MAG: hypothetical protein F6K08_28090 [Okeania sp. SIO1H6]|nr:hypothetical protein [Okeania sp. SIO1H6]
MTYRLSRRLGVDYCRSLYLSKWFAIIIYPPQFDQQSREKLAVAIYCTKNYSI